jgi:electron transfer flavoprotein alpha subunit
MSPKAVWILAEQREGKVADVSYELITRGRELADQRDTELCAVILGDNLSDAELQTLIDRGCDRVLHASAPELRHFLPEPYDKCLQALIVKEQPEILIAAATSTGRTVMPCVAGTLRAGLTADCTGLQIEADTGNLLQTRPAAGGNIMATIKTPERRPQMATVRPHSTRPAPSIAGRTGRIDRWQPPADLLKSRVRRVDYTPAVETQAIQDADVVVAVGRGFKKADNVELARKLAGVLDGAVGASREAVDRGWLPYPAQVGLSGKTVSPKLYIAVGVSGTVQHLAGMQTSETIIAINSDSEAPIFNYAEIGLCGDLFTLLPMLTAKIAAAKQS